jgi:hypothetical protein
MKWSRDDTLRAESLRPQSPRREGGRDKWKQENGASNVGTHLEAEALVSSFLIAISPQHASFWFPKNGGVLVSTVGSRRRRHVEEAWLASLNSLGTQNKR